jgi:hypothetical protein
MQRPKPGYVEIPTNPLVGISWSELLRDPDPYALDEMWEDPRCWPMPPVRPWYVRLWAWLRNPIKT